MTICDTPAFSVMLYPIISRDHGNACLVAWLATKHSPNSQCNSQGVKEIREGRFTIAGVMKATVSSHKRGASAHIKPNQQVYGYFTVATATRLAADVDFANC